jgi:hypothetical protein
MFGDHPRARPKLLCQWRRVRLFSVELMSIGQFGGNLLQHGSTLLESTIEQCTMRSQKLGCHMPVVCTSSPAIETEGMPPRTGNRLVQRNTADVSIGKIAQARPTSDKSDNVSGASNFSSVGGICTRTAACRRSASDSEYDTPLLVSIHVRAKDVDRA